MFLPVEGVVVRRGIGNLDELTVKPCLLRFAS